MSAASPIPAGLHYRTPFASYVQFPGISISGLKELRKSPLHFRHRLANPKESRLMALGSAAHCAVLEPMRFGREYATWTRKASNGNSCPRKGQYWDAFLKDNPGKEVLLEADYQAALAISSAVHGHDRAGPLLADGDAEVSLSFKLLGEQCRARLDWLTEDDAGPIVVELKTSADIRAIQFGNTAARMGYHLQVAWYADAIQYITGCLPRVKVIAVESAAPHDVAVYGVPEDVMDQGRKEYQALLETLRRCRQEQSWRGVDDGQELELTLPEYVFGESLDAWDNPGAEAPASDPADMWGEVVNEQ